MLAKATPTVLVTGGSGRLGQYVIRELISYAYQVVNVDLRPSALVRTIIADATDLESLLRISGEFDAIVHLAAIPSMRHWPPQEVFRINIVTAHNVLEFAYIRQIKNIILASSEAVIGLANSYQQVSPIFLPIDELHPVLAQDAYGLSKALQENLATGFAQRAPGTSIKNLRFAWVLEEERYESALADIKHTPDIGVKKLFAYVDARDVSKACRQAVEYWSEGSETFFIAAADTLVAYPSLRLAETYFALAEVRPGRFNGRQSLIDCRKAQERLGFRPEYSWTNNKTSPQKG